MALIDIIRDVAPLMGVDASNTNQRDYLIARINKAANEIYSITDIPKCLREQVFCIDTDEKQLTLPYYVYKVRGIRNYDTTARIKLEDMRPRYFKGPQAAYQNILTWREKPDIILARELSSAGPLTLKLASAATVAFTVTIVGSTTIADQVSETVSFAIGATSRTTTGSFTAFPGVVNIQKSRLIDQNISIQDLNGNEVSFIANSEYKPQYTLIQNIDNKFAQTGGLLSDSFEILYKVKFSNFRNDYDVFPVSNFDDIVGWKTLAQYYSTLTNPKAKQNVLDYETRIVDAMTRRVFDAENSDEKEIQFAPNRFVDAIRNSYPVSISIWR